MNGVGQCDSGFEDLLALKLLPTVTSLKHDMSITMNSTRMDSIQNRLN